MKDQYPLITCLCVTHNRPRLLERAITCFENQTYVNKQLVVVYEEIDSKTNNYIALHPFESNVKLIKIPLDNPKLTLGELRNISVQEADGYFVCQWDDDDWYGCDRLEIQLKYLREEHKRASVLLRWILFDVNAKKSYLSFPNPWEGSILCEKSLLEEIPYPSLVRGEDTPVIRSMIEKEAMAFIENEPEVYVYHFHGENTWDDMHFKSMIYYCVELSEEYNKEVIECITF